MGILQGRAKNFTKGGEAGNSTLIFNEAFHLIALIIDSTSKKRFVNKKIKKILNFYEISAFFKKKKVSETSIKEMEASLNRIREFGVWDGKCGELRKTAVKETGKARSSPPTHDSTAQARRNLAAREEVTAVEGRAGSGVNELRKTAVKESGKARSSPQVRRNLAARGHSRGGKSGEWGE